MEQNQEGKTMKIDLTGHKNPARFLEEAKTRYFDENVSLSLDGETLLIKINPNLHTQEQINIFSFLSDRAKEQIWPM